MAEAPPNTTILPGESRWSWRNHGGENRFTEDRREKPTRPDIFMFKERVKSEGSRARIRLKGRLYQEWIIPKETVE
jgi:hypothetical protein